MFRRLIASIDALGDRIHPIVVLQLRRQFRVMSRGHNLLVWTILLAAAAIGVILYADVLLAHPTLSNWQRGLYGNSPLAQRHSPFIAMQSIFVGIGIASFGIWQQYRLTKRADPLLVISPMSEREFYAGYYQIGTWTLFVAVASLLPYLTFAYLLRLIPLSWVIFYPFVLATACWTISNICYPIALTSRTLFQRIVLIILAILSFLSLAFIIPLVLLSVMEPSLPRIPYVTAMSIELLRFERWFPVFLVAVPLYSFAAWRLIDYNLERRRSFWRKLFRSLIVYAAVSVFLAALWFGLCFVL